MPDITPHKWSKEVLYHIKCGNCEHWFTISDRKPKSHMSCPDCQSFRKMEEIQDENEKPGTR